MVIEDVQYLQILDSYTHDAQRVIFKYNELTNGKKDKAELLELYLARNAELTELLRQQTRAIRYMKGEKVEPEVQFAEAVIEGTFGGGSAV